jgi:hypothetical protein
MFWMWSSSRGGTYVGMGGMVIGLIFLVLMLSPFVSLRGFLPFLLIFFAPALLALMSRRSARYEPRRMYDLDAPPEVEGKLKQGETLAEMMAILDEDDIDELRRRVKARLAEQIESASLDEVATFDELLNEAKEKRR